MSENACGHDVIDCARAGAGNPASGDHVAVSYHKVAGTLHASDVRVMVKGTH